MLLRILILITISIELLASFTLHKHKREKFIGKEIYGWKTKIKTEFIASSLKIGIYTSAILLLIFIDEGLNNLYKNYKILLDIFILILLWILFLIPKEYLITDKGILINSIFRQWKEFFDYKKKGNIIILYQKKYGLVKKIDITLENSLEVEKIISKKIEKKATSLQL